MIFEEVLLDSLFAFKEELWQTCLFCYFLRYLASENKMFRRAERS